MSEHVDAHEAENAERSALAQSHELVCAYFEAVTAGELPDDLLTADMSAWLTTMGPRSKEEYQEAIRLLARMCAEPIRFTIDAITAEQDRAVAEARSQATLINGETYAMTYVFCFRIRNGRIAWIAEHYNAFVAQEKLVPLMARIASSESGQLARD